MLEILKPGLETSIQDYPGRIGSPNPSWPGSTGPSILKRSRCRPGSPGQAGGRRALIRIASLDRTERF